MYVGRPLRVAPGDARPSNRTIADEDTHRSPRFRSSASGMTPEKCESELDDITSRTPMVKFLLEALSKAGCPVKREFFEVQYCSQAVLGVGSDQWCCVTTIS